MKIELFRANCKLCDRTEVMIRAILPPGVEMEDHRAEECRDGSCCRLAESYGVRAVPTLVVDGNILQVGMPDERRLREIEAVLRSFA